MARKPLFSIVIPVFNRAETILTTLESVKNQTFKDFECVIVDDGSSDSDKLVRNINSLGDSRFKYIRRENGGACAARNTGIDLANGELIAFLDSDDQFIPTKLERVAEIVSPLDSDFFLFSRLNVDRGTGRFWIKPPMGPKSDERIDEYIMCTTGWVQTSTVVLPTSLARSVRFNERLPSSQDTDFAVRVFALGTNFIFVPEPLVIFNDIPSPNRVSTQKKCLPLLEWVESLRGTIISERAYWGYRGWQCARVMSYGSRLGALRLYGQSAIKGVYSLRLAARIALQIALPKSSYQNFATKMVSIFGKRSI